MQTTLKVAVMQSPAELVGPQERLDWLTNALEGKADWDLVILPELFQCGYYIADNVITSAEPSNGPFAQAVASLAKTHNTAILYGYSEQEGDDIFNSAQCIDNTGNIAGHHRKLLLPPGFEGDHFISGHTSELFEIGGFKIGILICYDVEFPENLRQVASMGAEIIAVPTALGAQWGVVSEKLVPTRAFENGVYVCYANSAGHENGMDYFGGSCIVAPNGTDLARAAEHTEIITATLIKTDVTKAQARPPYLVDRQRLPWS